MELTYLGGGAVLVTTKQSKVLVNPPLKEYGLDFSKTKVDATLLGQVSDTPFKMGESFTIASPGEYEMKDVSVRAVAARLHIDDPKTPPNAVMYVVEAGAVRTLFTGNIAEGLSDSQIDEIGDVDVVVIPVGGHGLTLDASAAAAIVSQLEPSIVVPVHYEETKVKYPMPQAGVDLFLKEVGGEGTEPVDKLKIGPADLLVEGQRVVVLKPQS